MDFDFSPEACTAGVAAVELDKAVPGLGLLAELDTAVTVL
jgi:hypothetical protein